MISPEPTVDNTWGAAFVGLIVAAMLYGVTTIQLYIYFMNYPNDSRRFKILALVVWMVDTTSLGLVASAMYGYLISDMLNPLARLEVNRAIDVDVALMGFLAFLTHGFLGTRVWFVCNKNMLIAAVLAVLSFTSLSLAIASSVISFRFELWTEKQGMQTLALAGTALVVVLDGLIASILCVYLLKQRATGKEVRGIIRRVCLFAINTGLTSSFLSIMNVATFVALPHTMVFLATNFVFTKVYANCLLANLNARQALRGKGYIDDETLSINLSALRAESTMSAVVIENNARYHTQHPNDSSFTFPRGLKATPRPKSPV